MAPSFLKVSKSIGYTCCKKPTGTQVVENFLRGRVAEFSYGEIQENQKNFTKKIRAVIEDVRGNKCYTTFYGFEVTRQTVMEQIKTKQTLIEVAADVKTKDGVIMRIFVNVVTQKRRR